MGGTATGVAAVGEGVCDAEGAAELLAGCGAEGIVSVLLSLRQQLFPLFRFRGTNQPPRPPSVHLAG